MTSRGGWHLNLPPPTISSMGEAINRCAGGGHRLWGRRRQTGRFLATSQRLGAKSAKEEKSAVKKEKIAMVLP